MATGAENLPSLTQWVGAVGTLEELYAKFPTGGQYGMFALVTGKRKFVSWDAVNNSWEPMDYFVTPVNLDVLATGDCYVWNADTQQFEIVNLVLWNEEDF